MKKFLLIVLLSTLCTNVFSSTYEPEYAKVVSVDCQWGIDEDNWERFKAHAETVKVVITDAGYAYMEKYGYNSFAVEVKPKSSIWHLFDNRKSQQGVLSRSNSSRDFNFTVRSESSCGESDFEVTVLEWY